MDFAKARIFKDDDDECFVVISIVGGGFAVTHRATSKHTIPTAKVTKQTMTIKTLNCI